ncbi:MAG: hypothetical protein ACXVZL_10265 [Gaiellaceae bacterium]
MRRLVLVSLAALAVVGPAVSARTAAGLLTGTTQISFGCPGPVREGKPSCRPWHPLANALFAVAGPGTTRRVRSDAEGHFTLRLSAGAYTVTPLAQPELHTLGGPPLKVVIRSGRTTRILVRFAGFPQMA